MEGTSSSRRSQNRASSLFVGPHQSIVTTRTRVLVMQIVGTDRGQVTLLQVVSTRRHFTTGREDVTLLQIVGTCLTQSS